MPLELLHKFTHTVAKAEIPDTFLSPFAYEPHPLAAIASQHLQQYLKAKLVNNQIFTNYGNMFGVLVVKDYTGQLAYLAAYSGKLNEQWHWSGFVPPVFDVMKRNNLYFEYEQKINQCEVDIQKIESDKVFRSLSQKRDILEQEYQDEFQQLYEIHRHRKIQRHLQRDATKNQTDLQREALFKKLAYESQLDNRQQQNLKRNYQKRIKEINSSLFEFQSQIEKIKNKIKQLQQEQREKILAGYVLLNASGEQKSLVEFFNDGLPPDGAGDCVAVKLLQYAYQNQLTPVAIAEFWWGDSPQDSIRHHGQFYPACRGKCQPILPFMLTGLKVKERTLPGSQCKDKIAPEIVYEDESILIVNKPCGLLSVPGNDVQDSVLTRIQQRYPDLDGPLIVHRLDLATSGIMVIAKNKSVHKALQRQFIKRKISKRYVAILSGKFPKNSSKNNNGDKGIISLPLRVDLLDRPRQLVCQKYGKPAITRWEVISTDEERTRIYFYPETGRTHQLRLHAAHRDGLNTPIVGDRLYGKAADQLYLHAEYLSFIHPDTGERFEWEVPAPF